jgi:hypothetical protein
VEQGWLGVEDRQGKNRGRQQTSLRLPLGDKAEKVGSQADGLTQVIAHLPSNY